MWEGECDVDAIEEEAIEVESELMDDNEIDVEIASLIRIRDVCKEIIGNGLIVSQ